MPNYGGFDCSAYPGDSAMQAWKDSSTYQFVGYYLPSPCHHDTAWTGKYRLLKQMGWGFALLYVGQQAAGGRCSANTLTRNQGLFDGADTNAKSQAEGFPRDSIVFLDVEGMDSPVPREMIDYYRGWISAILDGGYLKPGTYCAAKNAMDLFDAAQAEYAAHGLPGGAPSFWVVKVGPSFDPMSSSPTACGLSFANVWQGKIDVPDEIHGGVSFAIDQNAADSWDPSEASQLETVLTRETGLESVQAAPFDSISARTTEIFSSVLKELRTVQEQDTAPARLFFPNGIDSIDVEIAQGTKDAGLSVKISVAGPKKP